MTQHHFYQTLIDLGFPAGEAEAMLRTANLGVGSVEKEPLASREYERAHYRALLTPDMIAREAVRILEKHSREFHRVNALYGYHVTCPEDNQCSPSPPS